MLSTPEAFFSLDAILIISFILHFSKYIELLFIMLIFGSFFLFIFLAISKPIFAKNVLKWFVISFGSRIHLLFIIILSIE